MFANTDMNFSLGLTGKAFEYLCHEESERENLIKILFKAQIYARMSPA